MLEIDGVSKRYGDVVAADDVTMSVNPGSLVGFVGRNGSGKTTTMRIALGLVAPDHGEVRFDGHPATAADRRCHVGYLPEERGLYPRMRVLDQLIYFARLSGLAPPDAVDSSQRWLDRLGIADRATSRLEELSLGNQQRVQLAAALVHRPRTLVLDEPFSGLDPVGVDVMTEVLGDEVRAGAGVVFSSHQLELVERLCDELVIIDSGRVVASGATAELQAAHAEPQVVVEVAGAPFGWADQVAGVEVARTDGPRTVLDLRGASEVDVLDAARAAGTVRHFELATPTVAELFRHIVRDDGESTEDKGKAA